jgi:hypothetical protein
MGGAKAHHDGIVAFSQIDFTEDLKNITIPVLVMRGDDDQIVPYADSAPLSARLLRNSTLKTCKGSARYADDSSRNDLRRPADTSKTELIVGDQRARKSSPPATARRKSDRLTRAPDGSVPSRTGRCIPCGVRANRRESCAYATGPPSPGTRPRDSAAKATGRRTASRFGGSAQQTRDPQCVPERRSCLTREAQSPTTVRSSPGVTPTLCRRTVFRPASRFAELLDRDELIAICREDEEQFAGLRPDLHRLPSLSNGRGRSRGRMARRGAPARYDTAAPAEREPLEPHRTAGAPRRSSASGYRSARAWSQSIASCDKLQHQAHACTAETNCNTPSPNASLYSAADQAGVVQPAENRRCTEFLFDTRSSASRSSS